MSKASRRKIALVTTTINVPYTLDAMIAGAVAKGYRDDLMVVVVGDLKTPPAAAAFLADCRDRHATRVDYLDIPAQHKFLRSVPALDLLHRYNCIQRRNIGYLWAGVNRAEVIISVDDDNFSLSDDFWADHLIVGQTQELPQVSHPTGWWNVCERLVCDPPRHFYHRGYPKSRQKWKDTPPQIAPQSARVVVNAGLWLNNPDVDATANIEEPLNVTGMKPIAGGQRCTLAPGTWCPFNSQNTAFDVRILPASYLVVMLDLFRGYRIGRLDDIWMSYFVRAIADKFGDVVAYGPPLVRQDRNAHNILRDLSEELGGYLLTEHLVKYLRTFETKATDYSEGYLDLIYHLREMIHADTTIDEADRQYLRTMLIGMGAWQQACREMLPCLEQ